MKAASFEPWAPSERKSVENSTVSIVSESWPWPDSLDALVAAPKHHALLLEDDRVRVLQTTIPAGDVAPLHTHCWVVSRMFRAGVTSSGRMSVAMFSSIAARAENRRPSPVPSGCRRFLRTPLKILGRAKSAY